MAVAKLAQDFPIFPMAMKILINEADRNSDRAASEKWEHCIHNKIMLFFQDKLASTLSKFHEKHLLQYMI